MSGFFTPEALERLSLDHSGLLEKCRKLQKRYVTHPFKTERARENARHGLCRRLWMLLRSINLVFETLPPDLTDIPDQDEVDKATIAIHSFVLNTYGCLDNLAWIWVSERNIKGKGGSDLTVQQVGLGKSKSYSYVRNGLSDGFRTYLDSRDTWFENLKGFRDALAHRIPLYIPPFIVDPSHAEKYSELERAWYDALGRGDMNTCDLIEGQQLEYKFFRPWMTHSHLEKAPVVVFHKQLLIDFLTIEEASHKSLDELTLPSKT